MPNCVALNFDGSRCNHSHDNMPYFWYNDALGRLEKKSNLCQIHSDKILAPLLRREYNINNTMNNLSYRIDSLKKQLNTEHTLKEQQQKIKQAVQDGLPRPKFKQTEEIKKELNASYERIRRLGQIKKQIRNKECRYCGFPLNEPQEKELQLGDRYSHADFHSGYGYGRAWIMLHTECGLKWLGLVIEISSKDSKYLNPVQAGQRVLFKQ